MSTVTVETPSGYRADLSVLKSISGRAVVRASGYLKVAGREVRTPHIELRAFEGEDAIERATRYLFGLKAAFESDGAP